MLKLRILQTTDIRMNLVACDDYQDKPADEFGLDRTATLIKAARAEVRDTLLLDNAEAQPSGWVHPLAHLARYAQVRLVKDNGNGTALYEPAP